MADPFIAEVKMMANTFAPRGWALCDGSILPIGENTALFSLIGTTYGGNGRSTMGLPDLQGRTPMHWGMGPGLSHRALGEFDGEPSVTLMPSHLPSHIHQVKGLNANGSQAAPSQGCYLSRDQRGTPGENIKLTVPATAGQSVAMSASALTIAGDSQSHENHQPSLVLPFYIALLGIYPSRN
ncbi:phage tail protein [Ferrimonas pelagia]|uniref:Tail fiber protein n=1 Tax=Ferrimonas pelagia TaxID=1177826 RepID=A0ABP9EL67_9GAMM